MEGWKKIKNIVIKKYSFCRDEQYCMMIDLLDNLIPASWDVWAVYFRSDCWEAYEACIFRLSLWSMFLRFRRKNYNKLPLAFLSDVLYWKMTGHPIYNRLQYRLVLFTDYYAENFHSLLRRGTKGT